MAKFAVRNISRELKLLEPQNIEQLKYGDYVVYEDDDGLNCNKVIILPSCLVFEKDKLPRVKFIRIANDKDFKQLELKKQQEDKAYIVCKQKIAQHNLAMKLVKAQYNFSFTHLTFYFTANGYVDFRNLLKDLTSTFRKTRIMLLQIGVRDEAALIGGIGVCGRELCCCTFLKQFESITLKLAKDQGLPLNPAKISGYCGRLMCCLNYEQKFYEAVKSQMPEIGTILDTPKGKGEVIEHNVLKNTISVQISENEIIEIPCNIDENKVIEYLTSS